MADGSSVCARPAAGRRPGIVTLPAKGGIGAVRAWPGRLRAVGERPGKFGLLHVPGMARQKVRQSGMPTSGTGCASGPGGRGCASGVPAPSRTAGSSAAAPVDQEGGHGERHEDAPWAVSAMAGAVPEAAALPRPGARNVSFPVARLRRPHRMTDTPCPGRAGGRRPARTSGPSLSCRSPRIRACRSSGRSSRRRPAGRGPVRSGARCRSSRRASPRPASSRWSRTSRTGARGRPSPLTQPDVRPAGRRPVPGAGRPPVCGRSRRRSSGSRLKAFRSQSFLLLPSSFRTGSGAGGTPSAWSGRTVAAPSAWRQEVLDPSGGSWRSGACRRPCARSGGRSRPPGAETPAGRRPALQRLPAPQGGVDAPGPQRRRPRGPAPSSRSRIRVSDGAFPTPKSARRFRARTGSSPPRTCRPDCRSDGIPGEKTASPDIRQSARLKSRVTVGSGMRSKHARTARSMPGIDRCLRKESLVIFKPDK